MVSRGTSRRGFAGAVARLHLQPRRRVLRIAVVSREPSLDYTYVAGTPYALHAVVSREPSLDYTRLSVNTYKQGFYRGDGSQKSMYC